MRLCRRTTYARDKYTSNNNVDTHVKLRPFVHLTYLTNNLYFGIALHILHIEGKH